MDEAVDRSKAPSRLLLALEVRGIWEFQTFLAAYPLPRGAPRGDGETTPRPDPTAEQFARHSA